jgi:hypothetical protein
MGEDSLSSARTLAAACFLGHAFKACLSFRIEFNGEHGGTIKAQLQNGKR